MLKITIEASQPELDALLDGIAARIAAKLKPIVAEGTITMSQELDQLTAQVHSNSDVVQSAITLINGIAARIAAAGTDPAALSALTSELNAQDAALAAAVAANTPADAGSGGTDTTGGAGTDTTGGAAA